MCSVLVENSQVILCLLSVDLFIENGQVILLSVDLFIENSQVLLSVDLYIENGQVLLSVDLYIENGRVLWILNRLINIRKKIKEIKIWEIPGR